jgi:pyruvate carboxylase
MNKKDPKSLLVTQDDITNIIVTALEGGIGYWACLINDDPVFNDYYNGENNEQTLSEYVADILANGQAIRFYDTDLNYGEAEKWELNNTKLALGIRQYINENGIKHMRESLDSMEADKIIQYALFGELIYG